MSKPVPRAKVLIVDDHAIVREGLVSLISRQANLEVCGEADGVADALKLLSTLTPDIVIVDISLPDGNGLDLVRRIKAAQPDVRILVASMYDEGLYAERALRAGATGYINKQEASRKIIAAIHCVLSRKVYLSRRMSDRLLTRLGTGDAPQGPSATKLSDRELEVFQLIGNGMQTVDIAAKLHLSVKTIETHRQRIKVKLGLSNSAELSREAAHWVLENG